ncbi:Vesicle transport protein GOT1B [Larimichthys crocea]|uniref:Uncharacterized protein n=1 Tax=Larimichthys crocea TaxID=215358 RepID=A0ACD3QD87_LARCR|nr:Vesicle transport protein GOT1B [Larimichthys crocea]
MGMCSETTPGCRSSAYIDDLRAWLRTWLAECVVASQTARVASAASSVASVSSHEPKRKDSKCLRASCGTTNNADMISLTDSQKIGMGLTGFGVFFLFFGMVLFFDKALLAIGNILFVSGLSFVIGLERTFRFFFQRHKVKATSFFLGGVFVVLIGWPIIGVVLEIYGFFLLFRGFFPVAVGFIRRVPVLGSLLSLPGISTLVDKIGESNTMV